jgi:hypothetical protein
VIYCQMTVARQKDGILALRIAVLYRHCISCPDSSMHDGMGHSWNCNNQKTYNQILTSARFIHPLPPQPN